MTGRPHENAGFVGFDAPPVRWSRTAPPVRWSRTVRQVPRKWTQGLGTYVHPSASIGKDTRLGCNVYVGPGVTVGANCRVQSGAVIGEDGFGYVREADGSWTDKPHPFGVCIADDVHIGANTCIDRGSWRDTTIEQGARIDNLVHVAHNVIVRRNAVVVAGAELSGSVVVGEEAWIGPKACVKERLLIGYRALVGIGAVVIRDVQTNTTVAGNPARVINAEVGVRAEM